MRLSDAGLRRRPTKLLYPDHRLPLTFNEDAAPRSLEPIVRLLALRGTPNRPAHDGLAPHFFKYRRKNAPRKISVKRGTGRQIYRRNNDIYVSQEDDYRAKTVGEVTGHDTRGREYKCCDQQLREYAAPAD